MSIYLSLTGRADGAGKDLCCGGSAGCPWLPPDDRDLSGGCSGLCTQLAQGRFAQWTPAWPHPYGSKPLTDFML